MYLFMHFLLQGRHICPGEGNQIWGSLIINKGELPNSPQFQERENGLWIESLTTSDSLVTRTVHYTKYLLNKHLLTEPVTVGKTKIWTTEKREAHTSWSNGGLETVSSI